MRLGHRGGVRARTTTTQPDEVPGAETAVERRAAQAGAPLSVVVGSGGVHAGAGGVAANLREGTRVGSRVGSGRPGSGDGPAVERPLTLGVDARTPVDAGARGRGGALAGEGRLTDDPARAGLIAGPRGDINYLFATRVAARVRVILLAARRGGSPADLRLAGLACGLAAGGRHLAYVVVF